MNSKERRLFHRKVRIEMKRLRGMNLYGGYESDDVTTICHVYYRTYVGLGWSQRNVEAGDGYDQKRGDHIAYGRAIKSLATVMVLNRQDAETLLVDSGEVPF